MKLSTLQIVTEAQKVVGNWDCEDIITETIRMGYNISPVIRAFKAIQALREGRAYIDKAMWTKRDEKDNYDSVNYHQKWRQARIAQGLCTRCGKPKENIENICSPCREKYRLYIGERKRKKRSAV